MAPVLQERSLVLQAPAKINLYLKIVGRRPDGYHELVSLMQKVALYDELTLSLTAQTGISLSCSGAAALPVDERNIAFRAAQLFLTHIGRAGQGVRIVLHKHIPMAAGLGGGSSDAAAVLKGLNQLLATNCSTEKLAAIAVRLGADVPFFVHDLPAAWATGIGERLQAAQPLCGYQVLLVNPGIDISTKWAYETFALTAGTKKFNLFSFASESGSRLKQGLFRPEEMVNDLEGVSVGQHRVIGILKHRLLRAGAAGAMMSGSGSTVFALFARDAAAQAEACRQELQAEYRQTYLVQPL
ncbi:4-(cytidine 5'-diphospho)-2-C-methyl-D-erythritol kinase [Candidatus Electronema sp. PJ]|uniref:4-(cytidine 5'-diphospho)-2-C-methyl-D-erythritol kinase n=1 Tax=Candidatus Electronema sp. PJ TaxID=3401572 RepID=UPI003AA85FDC